MASDRCSFNVSPKELAPSPLDTVRASASTTAYEREEHAAALQRRVWIADLGDVTRAEVEALEVVHHDPGRISRDLVANGAATFTAADVDEWCAERVTADWLDLSDFAQRSDPTIKLLSADTQTPLYTTLAHEALEAFVFDRATELAKQIDPLFDARALARAIADEESALGITFSEEQLAVCELLRYRFALVQGDAGTGKSTLMPFNVGIANSRIARSSASRRRNSRPRISARKPVSARLTRLALRCSRALAARI